MLVYNNNSFNNNKCKSKCMNSNSLSSSATQATSKFSAAIRSNSLKKHKHNRKTILTTDKEFLKSQGYNLLKKKKKQELQQ